MGSFCIALLALTLAGCGSSGDSPLVVATTWPSTERTQIEVAVRESSGDRRPIIWVVLGPGESLESVVDRRGGVDVLLGGPALAYDRLLRGGRIARPNSLGPVLWRAIRPPNAEPWPASHPPGDPRVDPDSLALAKSRLLAEGWPKGYEGLVRAAAQGGLVMGSVPLARSECVALVRGTPKLSRGLEFVQTLEARGFVESPPSSPIGEVRTDDLLADLLGSALVDALDELREAAAALDRFGHPARAEAAMGERPPWPPASVTKLLADPSGEVMIETLLEQVAPDLESRAWLVESWSKPKRQIDGALLAEVAGGADGRLALEPRFRAWLRGEWTAWTRQLYRRVARLAGGYNPS